MPLKTRSVTIGEGLPKICVPLVGCTEKELIEECKQTIALPCQLIEWRADYFLAGLKKKGRKKTDQLGNAVISVLRELRVFFEGPLIVTIRTKPEGGAIELSRQEYFNLNEMIAKSQLADFVDIQAFQGEGRIDEQSILSFIDVAHKCGTYVLLSNHDFEKTPETEELLTRFFAMEALGGDMLKLAVMPHTEEDVFALLEACALMRDSGTEVPLIAISMGELGNSSRVCGGEVGSAVTFASGKGQSAPGQIDAVSLQNFIRQYY